MLRSLSQYLVCPQDSAESLQFFAFPTSASFPDNEGIIRNGVLFCPTCGAIYPIIQGIPRLIAPDLAKVDYWREKLFFEKNLIAFETNPVLKEAMQRRLAEQEISATKQELTNVETQWWNDFYDKEIKNIDYIKRLPGFPELAAGNRFFEYDEWFAKYLRPQIKGRRILEVGCGKSAFVYLRLNPEIFGYSYVGTDLSFNALLLASQYVPGQFIQCSAEAIPFKTSSFDILLCLGVVHHLVNWQKGLEEFFRVLESEGIVCFQEAVTKKRFFARWRTKSFTADKDSPNEADIPEDEFKFRLQKYAKVQKWMRHYSTVRFVFEYLMKLGTLMDQSRLLTQMVIIIDKIVLSTLGRILPEFEGGEILAILRKI